MSTVSPVVSVIICHHVGRLVDDCLTSVSKSTGVTYETIVVTSDPSFSTTHTVTTVFHEGGPAEKRNVGRTQAHGSYLVFLDDDVEIRTDTLSSLVSGLSERTLAGMGFSKIFNAERNRELDDAGSFLTPTGFLWSRAGSDLIDRGQFDTPCRILASKSATCVIKTSTFDQVGGFDPDYFILGEETDLAYRVWLSGEEVWYLPQAVSYHWFNTSRKPRTQYYTDWRIHGLGCRNYLLLLLTHLGASRLLRMLPAHLCGWVLAACGFVVRAQYQRASHIARGIWWVVTHPASILAKRRAIQRSRVLSDRYLMSIVMVSPPWSYYGRRLWQYVWKGLHG